eukprot:Rhum_TRINITY_DN15008_c2_g1::Rhum_TRINITY_DN15008_c2_g1_i7::g.134494::m.134494
MSHAHTILGQVTGVTRESRRNKKWERQKCNQAGEQSLFTSAALCVLYIKVLKQQQNEQYRKLCTVSSDAPCLRAVSAVGARTARLLGDVLVPVVRTVGGTPVVRLVPRAVVLGTVPVVPRATVGERQVRALRGRLRRRRGRRGRARHEVGELRRRQRPVVHRHTSQRHRRAISQDTAEGERCTGANLTGDLAAHAPHALRHVAQQLQLHLVAVLHLQPVVQHTLTGAVRHCERTLTVLHRLPVAGELVLQLVHTGRVSVGRLRLHAVRDGALRRLQVHARVVLVHAGLRHLVALELHNEPAGVEHAQVERLRVRQRRVVLRARVHALLHPLLTVLVRVDCRHAVLAALRVVAVVRHRQHPPLSLVQRRAVQRADPCVLAAARVRLRVARRTRGADVSKQPLTVAPNPEQRVLALSAVPVPRALIPDAGDVVLVAVHGELHPRSQREGRPTANVQRRVRKARAVHARVQRRLVDVQTLPERPTRVLLDHAVPRVRPSRRRVADAAAVDGASAAQPDRVQSRLDAVQVRPRHEVAVRVRLLEVPECHQVRRLQHLLRHRCGRGGTGQPEEDGRDGGTHGCCLCLFSSMKVNQTMKYRYCSFYN